MSAPDRHVKRYTRADLCQQAVRNHMWLSLHATPLRLPAILSVGSTRLFFEFVEGRHARPSDLLRIAAHLGDAHGAAWVDDLHSAKLDRPHGVGGSPQLPDYPTSRRRALAARHSAGLLPTATDLDAALRLLEQTAIGPTAFYKDSNPRNFLVTETRLVTIDMDDLTLAPFGYDLAKLIVTMAMTHGPLPDQAAHRALAAYNRAAAAHHRSLGLTGMAHLSACMRLHALLTAPYLGRHGYDHALPGFRPDGCPVSDEKSTG